MPFMKLVEMVIGSICGKFPPMRSFTACVGLIVLIGCFVLVIAPDDWPTAPIKPIVEMPIVVIDPGHGGKDEGAKSRGVLEKTLTLDLAFRVDRALRDLGYRTILTRNDDRFVSLAERVAIANAVEGSVVFVSIHFNQGSARDISGIETFYALNKTPPPPPQDWTWVGWFSHGEVFDNGEELASAVQLAATEKTGARDRGIRPRSLYVTRNTRMPAILVEGGFITNAMEARLLREDAYASRLARAIAEGVDAWWHARSRPTPGPLVKAGSEKGIFPLSSQHRIQ